MDGMTYMKLEKYAKNKDFFYEYLSLREMDNIRADEEDPMEVFRKKLIENNEQEFLQILIDEELI